MAISSLDRPPAYYPAFDWLRFALASVVMLGHDARTAHLIGWHPAGNFAVQVFFSLSGWLIGGLLLQTDREHLTRFYWNRVCRIWAPYFVALVLLMAATALKGPITPRMAEFFIYKATFTYNLFGPPQLAASAREMPLQGTGNHFWSVDAEEQFYLIAPLLLVVLPARWGRSLGVWSVVAVAALWSGVFPSIVLGVLAALLKQHYPECFTARIRGIALAVAIASTLLAVAGLPYMMVAPIAAVSWVVCLSVVGQVQPIGKFAGAISYPLYLNHWIGVFAANALFGKIGMKESIFRDISAIALNIVLASVLYLLVDKPVLNWRRQGWSSLLGLGAIVTAYGLAAAGILYGLNLGRAVSFGG